MKKKATKKLGRPAGKKGKPRGRPKGSTKRTPELVALAASTDFQDQIKSVLMHVLELFKASLIDAFRQYVESKLRASQPASVEAFMEGFKHTVAIHGVTKETLLGALSESELELLANNQAQVAVEQVTPVEAGIEEAVPLAPVVEEALAEAAAEVQAAPVAQPEPKKEKTNTSVFDALDMIEL